MWEETEDVFLGGGIAEGHLESWLPHRHYFFNRERHPLTFCIIYLFQMFLWKAWKLLEGGNFNLFFYISSV